MDWLSRPVPIPIRKRLAISQLALWRPSEERRAGERIGTKHDPVLDPDYHWNSCVPHLLNGHDARGLPARSARNKGDQKPGNTPEVRTPLVRASTPRDVIRYSGSHFGSTLKPGGAVLTRGVFRRSGSVACIRVDASPNEVPTRTMMHDRCARGQTDRGRVTQSLYFRYAARITSRPTPPGARWCR
jgi:hypothetical protein